MFDFRYTDTGVNVHYVSTIGTGKSIKLETEEIKAEYVHKVVNLDALEDGRPKKMTTGPLPGRGPATEQNSELDSEVVGTKFSCHNQECTARFDTFSLLNKHLSQGSVQHTKSLYISRTVRNHYGTKIEIFKYLGWFWADYEQLLRALFSFFQGQIFFENIVVFALKSCIISTLRKKRKKNCS